LIKEMKRKKQNLLESKSFITEHRSREWRKETEYEWL